MKKYNKNLKYNFFAPICDKFFGYGVLKCNQENAVGRRYKGEMIKKRCSYKAEKKDNGLYVTLQGEIDHHTAIGIRSEIDAMIYEERPARLSLDMSEIDFMDSSGLGLIMGRYALMQKIGGELSLIAPNERIMKILKLAAPSMPFKVIAYCVSLK